ncbi:MAG: gliding motility-associated C-terminal domain-containing protein [Cytophagales bacterium]
MSTFSQSAIVSGGEGVAVGDGFVSYSIGQIDFNYFGNVSLGVQQPIYDFSPPARLGQTITGFAAVPVLTVGGVYQISNVIGGNSGNPIIYTSSDLAALNVLGNTLIAFNSGVFTVTASQLGNSSYFPATSIGQVVTILSGTAAKASQLIVSTIPSPIVLKVGEAIALTAIATSGLPVSYSIGTGSSVTISGDSLKAIGVGGSTITIGQAGNTAHFAAPPITINILITDIDQPVSTVAGVFGISTAIPGTQTTYKQSLTGAGYTYQWSFDPDQNEVSFIDGTTSPDATIKFGKGAVSGLVVSAVYDANGNLVAYYTFPVNIDNTVSSDIATLANQLPEIGCTPKPSDCNSSYIRSFSVGKLANVNSGCSPSGYGDFTNTGKIDSLFMGESYDATLASGGQAKAYFGIWIDYNRDGTFGDPGEFIGSSLSSDSLFTVPNLLVANDPDFVGPRRLRIKMQTTGSLSATQSCQDVGGEGGETEDYLVFIQQADRLKAPNIITPNNDGKNDLFIIKGINTRKENRLVIVNRWGDKLVERINYANNWDGKSDITLDYLPRGTYFFFFTNGGDSIQGFVEVLTD